MAGQTLSRFWAACARARPVLESRRLPLLAALVGFVLVSPSIFTGFATEDWVQRGVLRRAALPGLRDLNVFGHGGFWTSAQVVARNREYQRAGWFPWITDPHFDVSFWRPLSSLTHHLDYWFWPDHPSIMHVENVLWYAALVAAVAVLYARFVEPRWLAGAAALLYAADDAHGHPVGWIMNRNALMATFFAVVALWAHDRFRREAWHLGVPLTGIAFALALGSAELATCAVGYFIAHAVFVDRAPVRHRLFGALPWLIPLVGWAVVYRRLGYTTHGSGLYIHPVGAPLAYAFEVVERGAVLLMGLLAAPFSDTWTHSGPYLQGLIVFWAATVLWFLARISWPLLRDVPGARFWLAGVVLSLPPACATFPEDRLLLIAGVGAFPFLALLVVSLFERARRDPARERGTRLVAVALLTLHAFVGPALLPSRSLHMQRYDARVRAAGQSAYALSRGAPTDALFVVNGEDFYFTGMMAITRVARGERTTLRMMTLAGTLEPMTIRRLDDRRLEVRPRDGFVSRVFDRLYRSRSTPFRRGSTLDLTGIDVTIAEVNQWGEPVAAVFAFALPLDSPVYHWVVWKGDRYEPFELPKIGASAVISG
ncbi:MAG TPA: hypothetical protein VH062_23875 [Polyangiaceae bacterium]|nr:hypothetical protein [Polyangiaceae bacterium]